MRGCSTKCQSGADSSAGAGSRGKESIGSMSAAALWQWRSNRIGLLLVRAVLEWVLIAVLLLNGLFSYLITKFAAFFGLTPPCVLCSRVDKVFESAASSRDLYRRLLCDVHSAEISQLGYCSVHCRLADTGDMCEDCSASRPACAAALSWMKRSEMGQELTCSCCGVMLESGFYSPFFLVKPSMQVLELTKNGLNGSPSTEDLTLMVKEASFEVMAGEPTLQERKEEKNAPNHAPNVDEKIDQYSQDSHAQTVKEASFKVMAGEPTLLEHEEDKNLLSHSPNVDEKMYQCHQDAYARKAKEVSLEVMTEGPTLQEQNEENNYEKEELDCRNADMSSALSVLSHPGELRSLEHDEEQVPVVKLLQEKNLLISDIGNVEVNDGSSHEISQNTSSCEDFSYIQNTGSKGNPKNDTSGNYPDNSSVAMPVHPDEHISSTERKNMFQNVDAVTKLCDERKNTKDEEQELPTSADKGNFGDNFARSIDIVEDHVKNKSPFNTFQNLDKVVLEPAVTDCHTFDQLSPEADEVFEKMLHVITAPVEGHDDVVEMINLRISSHIESLEDGSDKITMGNTGGAASDVDSSELLTVDHLRTALESAQESLNKLYAELEHERSSAAIAADETLSMINRLQEEKAALQMEAMQYQRLMEQQSEYDQETLEMLNDLVRKREKEKQDLEGELEECHRKIRLYEAKEKRTTGRNEKDWGCFAASSSGEEDSEGSPCCHETAESTHCYINETFQDTPEDPVLAEDARQLAKLGDCFAHFDEERFLILEQLKALEERLFLLQNADTNSDPDAPQLPEENDDAQNGHMSSVTNGPRSKGDAFADGKRSVAFKGKNLLPLFEAVDSENGNGLHKDGNASEDDDTRNAVMSNSREHCSVAEQVNHIYEKLEALEEDRGFLKQCIKSLKVSDKGLDLLQDISQHLRELRTLELQARSMEMLSQ